MNELNCLSYDPWGWDETDYVLLSDKFKTVRKFHMCQNCAHEIRPGMRVRVRTEVSRDDNVIGTFYWCIQCCEAMARSNDDAGISLSNRSVLRMKKEGQLPWDA